MCGVAVGDVGGWVIRRLLAVLRRGAVLRPGIAEVTSAVMTGVGVGLAWGSPLIALVVWAGWLGVALGAVDVIHHRLPDALTLPAIPITMLVVGFTAWLRPESGSAVTALLVAAVLSGLFLLLAVVAAGLASRRMTMKTAIPFGPFLLAGCWLVLAFPELVTRLLR